MSGKDTLLTHEHTAVVDHEADEGVALPTCPFCTINSAFPPVDPRLPDHSNRNTVWSPQKVSPPAYILLATEHAVAFMDIAPLTRGHVLVSPRKHRVKVGDLSPEEMGQIGKLLPIIARSVVSAVLPDIPHRDVDYNIVQNNGPGAAQVVPHVHFHIIPRPPLNYRPLAAPKFENKLPVAVQETTPQATRAADTTSEARSTTSYTPSKYPPAKIPTGLQRSYIQFGRGMRNELDEDDAESLVQEMRRCIRLEWQATYGEGSPSGSYDTEIASQPQFRTSSRKSIPQKL